MTEFHGAEVIKFLIIYQGRKHLNKVIIMGINISDIPVWQLIAIVRLVLTSSILDIKE